MTISEIIELAGGREAVAARTGKTGWAVKKWERNGIPDRHWPALIELSAHRLSADAIMRANIQAREAERAA